MNNDLIKKLRVKNGQDMLVINAPDGYLDGIGTLPDGSQLALESRSDNRPNLRYLLYWLWRLENNDGASQGRYFGRREFRCSGILLLHPAHQAQEVVERLQEVDGG